MTNYNLKFLPAALKEWKKLDHTLKQQFKKKLRERLTHPKVPKDKLSGFADVYKIKLRNAGYRLAYQVIEEELVVIVITVGKREGGVVYNRISGRL